MKSLCFLTLSIFLLYGEIFICLQKLISKPFLAFIWSSVFILMHGVSHAFLLKPITLWSFSNFFSIIQCLVQNSYVYDIAFFTQITHELFTIINLHFWGKKYCFLEFLKIINIDFERVFFVTVFVIVVYNLFSETKQVFSPFKTICGQFSWYHLSMQVVSITVPKMWRLFFYITIVHALIFGFSILMYPMPHSPSSPVLVACWHQLVILHSCILFF